MLPSNLNHWKTDQEYIDLLNFVIEKTENVASPMNIRRMAREFKEKSGAPQTVNCLKHRITTMRTIIPCLEHIETDTKVRMLYALGASINGDYLQELSNDALVEVDGKNRITHYKSERLELEGYHCLSTRDTKNYLTIDRKDINLIIYLLEKTGNVESPMRIKRMARDYKEKSGVEQTKLIHDYYENKNNADAVPKNKEEKEMKNLIEFITEKCDNVNSPLNLIQLAKDFIQQFDISTQLGTIRSRIGRYCREIQKAGFLDTEARVKQLFSLSETLNPDYLEKLRKAAHVEVDEKNRISYYKSNNGSLELRGDHSMSTKVRTGKLESERSSRSLINSYYEKKNDADAVPESEEEKEMWNLIEFITEKCESIDSPLSVNRLAEDFNKHFGLSRTLNCIRARIKKYCHDIRIVEFLDTHSKVKQLFCLSARLDSDYLKELRKDASVEVDDLNRITKYTANDGRLTLHGDHSQSAKIKLNWMERRKNKKPAEKISSSGGDEDEDSEEEIHHSEEDSDEYSSEEFDSEFNSEDENDSQVLRSNRSEEIEMREGEENDSVNTESAIIKTRSGRLSKKRHLDSEFSYDLANRNSSRAQMSTNPASSKPAKQKKIAFQKEQAPSSSNQNRSSPENSSISSVPSRENIEKQKSTEADKSSSDYHGPRIQEMEDYDWNPREDNIPESSPIDNNLEKSKPQTAEEHNLNTETQNTDKRSDADVPEPKPEKESLVLQNETTSTPPTNGTEMTPIEAPVKVEQEEPIKVENPTEDVKPEVTHNFKIKFFNAMKSLILFLDTSSLSDLKSKIHQKIRNFKKSDGMISNDEMIPALELLGARMADFSVVNLSESVESVSLIQFFSYLKASILNSKMIGVEGLLENISKRIEESQNKRIPLEKVANALRATLDVDGI